MTNFNIYCDESGNSGGNFLDPQQPFYVLAGWLVDRNESYRAKNRVSYFKDKYYNDKEELKGVEILKSNKGQNNANELLSGIGEYCSPFFIIAEKRYCIAAKMVETYLDPIHNDNVPTSHTWMNIERKNIANLIYNISVNSIEKFGEAYKDPKVEKFSEALNILIDELSQNGFSELSDVFSGAHIYMEDIYMEEFSMIDYLPEKAMRSLNLPVFTAFIQLIEKFTSNIGVKNIKMYHDNTKQFEVAYPEAFSWYARKKNEKVEFELQNGQIVLSSISALKSITFSDSKKSPLIQAADILASFINMFVTKTSLDKKLSPELIKLGNMLLGGLLVNDKFEGNGFCDLISSQKFLNKLVYNNGLVNELREDENNYDFPALFSKQS